MSEAAANNHPGLNSQEGRELRGDELRLLSINEARDILKIRHSTVKRLIEEGKIEIIPIGKRYKIPILSLYKFVEENTLRAEERMERDIQVDSRDYLNNKIESIIKKHTR